MFEYSVSFERLFSSILDLFYSIGEYFAFIFGIEADIPDRVNVIPNIDLQQFIPFDLQEVCRKFRDMWPALIDSGNFVGYLKASIETLTDVLFWTMLGLPFVLILWILLVESQLTEGDPLDRNKDSRPLKLYKKLTAEPKRLVREIFGVLKDNVSRHKVFLWILLALWFCAVNVATIAVEAVAFYFFFAATLNFVDLLTQLFKLLIDLVVMFAGAPFVFWLVGAALLFHFIRCRIGISVLERNEKKNKSFLRSLPIARFICGDMGRKKTTCLASMMVSQYEMDMIDSLKIMRQLSFRYPEFPFINLEKSIIRQVEKHNVYNFSTLQDWLLKKRRFFEKYPNKANIFRYDFMNNLMQSDDGLVLRSIWDDLFEYSKAYFLYTRKTSHLFANLAIRIDDEYVDEGHFPERKFDYFKKPSVDLSSDLKFSHILDFDMCRPGKTVVENNPIKGAFEYGSIGITEIGKEQGNSITNQEFKRSSPEANPKNDLFSYFVKLIRHSSTIFYKPFATLYADEQRASSWGADVRDTAKVLTIDSADDERLALPFYFLEDLFIEKVVGCLDDFELQYRKLRSDVTLTIYFVRKIIYYLHMYDLRIKNKFGYFVCVLIVESGNLEDDKAEKQVAYYYLSKKKDYSGRFPTDCYNGYFYESSKRTNIGIDDIAVYKKLHPSFKELNKQNSYLVISLNKNILPKRNSVNAAKLKNDRST